MVARHPGRLMKTAAAFRGHARTWKAKEPEFDTPEERGGSGHDEAGREVSLSQSRLWLRDQRHQGRRRSRRRHGAALLLRRGHGEAGRKADLACPIAFLDAFSVIPSAENSRDVGPTRPEHARERALGPNFGGPDCWEASSFRFREISWCCELPRARRVLIRTFDRGRQSSRRDAPSREIGR